MESNCTSSLNGNANKYVNLLDWLGRFHGRQTKQDWTTCGAKLQARASTPATRNKLCKRSVPQWCHLTCNICNAFLMALSSGDINNGKTLATFGVRWSSAAAWSAWSRLSCLPVHQPNILRDLATRCSRTITGDN